MNWNRPGRRLLFLARGAARLVIGIIRAILLEQLGPQSSLLQRAQPSKKRKPIRASPARSLVVIQRSPRVWMIMLTSRGRHGSGASFLIRHVETRRPGSPRTACLGRPGR